eukprot:scaffold14995_cov92-Cylindrotheca_fusiformis.AAC.5
MATRKRRDAKVSNHFKMAVWSWMERHSTPQEISSQKELTAVIICWMNHMQIHSTVVQKRLTLQD